MKYFDIKELEENKMIHCIIGESKENLINRIVKLKDKNVKLEKRIYKALCIIDEKRGEYDIPSDLEDVLRGREDENGRNE